MTAAVFETPGQGHRAVCDDETCQVKHPGVTIPWRTWILSEARAASLAADHNRTRHGAR